MPARVSSVPPPHLACIDLVPGDHGFWQWQNVAINVWLKLPEAATVNRLIAPTERGLVRYPTGMSAIHYVGSGVRIPGAETRAAFARLSRISDGRLGIISVVVDGGGFWSSALRSAVTGIRLLADGRFPIEMSASVDEALRTFPARHQANTGIATSAVVLSECVQDAIRQSR